MDRRLFLAGTSAGASVALAKPAIAQALPALKWRLTSSFPKSLDTIYDAAPIFAQRVSEITDGRFQIQVFAAGEIVPPLQAMDVVSTGTVEMAHTSSFYYIGKNEAFSFGTCMPFGMNARQQNAWMYDGGGIDLLNKFYAKYKIYALPMGNTGAQMGGWFRKEINKSTDLNGLKFRIAGLAGRVFQRLGAVPQQLAGGDIYPALERGTIDGVEWVGPYDDEKLGFHRVAPYYYFPAWWEGGPMIHLFINNDQWNSLPKAYKAAVQAAAFEANAIMLARYDMRNAPALRRLVAQGAQLRPFSREIMDSSFAATQDVMADIAKTNPDFAEIYNVWKAIRDDMQIWFRFAEFGFDQYMLSRS
jgi:TRAP-type mannitol/chloroaromatic compound transport system substrate-binding protein